jgi:hypothetical protein
MNVAQHVERRKQRVPGFPRAEHERAEQNRNHATHCRISVNDLGQIVVARVGDDFVGFRDRCFQAFPAECALHGLDLIRSGILGDQHGFGHADQRSHRRIERLRSLDDILLSLAIGATEYAAKHFVEHDEGGFREGCFHLSRENNQSGQSARRIEPREMLGAQNGRLSRNRRIARAVNPLFPIRADAENPDGLKAFSCTHTSGVRSCSSPTVINASNPAIVFCSKPSTRLFWARFRARARAARPIFSNVMDAGSKMRCLRR